MQDSRYPLPIHAGHMSLLEVELRKKVDDEATAFVSKPWKMENRPGNQGTFHISIGG